MRRALALIVAGFLATGAVACSEEKVTTTPASSSLASSTPAQQTSPTEQPSTPSATPSRTPSAAVGDTLDLTGLEDGEQLAVTVVKVVDPASAENEYATPDAGKRFVAVQFRLKNTGTAVYDDSPTNGARLVDTQGQQFDSAYEDTAAGPGFPGSVAVAPSDTALGFITFEVPTASKVAKVQFAMNSGFSGNTGQWTVS